MDTYFYKDGLRFECQRCSACCRYDPGYVYLSANDFKRLKDYLKLDFITFFNKYIRLVDVGSAYAISLKEKHNYDCIFWTEKGCSVYEARPIQCSSYPFWKGIADNADSWSRESLDCPGINKGKLISGEAVFNIISGRQKDSLLTVSLDTDLELLDEDTLLGSQGLASNTTYPFKTSQ